MCDVKIQGRPKSDGSDQKPGPTIFDLKYKNQVFGVETIFYTRQTEEHWFWLDDTNQHFLARFEKVPVTPKERQIDPTKPKYNQ